MTSATEQVIELLAHNVNWQLDIRDTTSNAPRISTALINQVLPPEIMCYIFCFLPSNSRSLHRYRSYPILLTSVCSLWRQLAISTPSLWNHVVLRRLRSRLVTPLPVVKLYLARACGNPLHLDFDGRWEMSALERNTALEMLTPHMSSLCSLDYFITDSDDARSILICWLKYGAPGSLTRLSVRAQNPGDATTEVLPQNSSLSYPSLGQFLRPIHTLTLSRVTMNWNCAAFSGLVKLEIENVQTAGSPTTTQFAHILAASPRLRCIKLRRVIIQSSEGVQVIPVELLHLQKLYLELELTSYERLISMLRPCSDELDLQLVTDSHQQDYFRTMATILCKQWAQVHIPIFHLGDGPLTHSSLWLIISTFRSIHTLVLHNLPCLKPLLETLEQHASNYPSDFPPKFYTIELNCCAIESEEDFSSIISWNHIQSFRLVGCWTVQFGELARVIEAKGLCLRLASVIPNLFIT